MKTYPRTLAEAVVFFSNIQEANERIARIKDSSSALACPKCQSREYATIPGRRSIRCKSCQSQYSVKTGTIFEDSRICVTKWLVVAWAVKEIDESITSRRLAAAINVSQKTACRMLHKMRVATVTKNFKSKVAA